MNIVINIQQYGDWDIPYSVKLMLSPNMYSKKSANNIVSRIENEHSNDVDAIVKELKTFGFVEMDSVDLIVSDGS